MSFCLVVWKMGIHIQREFSGKGNKVGESKIDKRRKKVTVKMRIMPGR